MNRTQMLFATNRRSGATHQKCDWLMASGRTVPENDSWIDRSTISMEEHLVGVVHSVDWHGGDPHCSYARTLLPFLTNLVNYGVRHKVILHVGRNADIAPHLSDQSFDCLFLDSFHELSAVQADIALFSSKVRPGGMIAFHDDAVSPASSGAPFGVTQAVDAYAEQIGASLGIVGSLAILKAPGRI